MVSLRQLARCIGLSGEILILRDFYGYTSISPPKPLSLSTQARLLKGSHIHLNLIQVGFDSLSNARQQNADREIDAAVQFTRDIYATVNIGIGRVQHYFITTVDANGRQNIDSNDEAEDLTNEWTVPNDAMDVFFVLSAGFAGLSRVDGPCDKNAKGMDGSVVNINQNVALALAHEVGHYLGLKHTDDRNNLMCNCNPNGGKLTADQGNNMREHCWIRAACQA